MHTPPPSPNPLPDPERNASPQQASARLFGGTRLFRRIAFPVLGAGMVSMAGVAVMAGMTASASQAQTSATTIASEAASFRLVTVAQGLRHPWALAFLPDGSILVTERHGALIRITPSGDARPVAGLPEIASRNQGGLLDLALHPDFATNRLVYLSASESVEGGTVTALFRARLGEDRLDDVERLFRANRPARPGRHYGSRIAFADAETLFLSIGDRGEPARAQDLGDHAGSILRLTADGAPAPGNPFAGQEGALAEIWSWGHRNPQGLIVDAETGIVWSTEHGPRGGDELNRIEPGLNYGWPEISHGVDYMTRRQIGRGREAEGMESPLHHWTPAKAPSGLVLYRGEAFPEWRGQLFSGALVGRHLRRIVIEDGRVTAEERLLADHIGRIRDVREAPDGTLYLLTDEAEGALYRLEPAP